MEMSGNVRHTVVNCIVFILNNHLCRFIRTELVQRDTVRGSHAKPSDRVYVVTGENRRNAQEKRHIRRNAGKHDRKVYVCMWGSNIEI